MADRAAPRISLLGSGGAQFAGQALGLLLALVVSHLIARRMGVGPDADAFLLGRRLITAVTEALNQIVIVVFIPLVAAQAAAGAGIWRIVARSGGGALLTGTALAVIFLVGAPWIVATVAPEFDAPTARLATQVMWILSLALPATVATVALAAYCNVRGTFGAVAAVRQLPRAGVVIALSLGTGGLALAAAGAYTLGAVAVTGIMLLAALRLSRGAPAPRAGPPKRSAAPRNAAAALVMATGAMVVLWLETAIAAGSGPGAVPMLDYAQRLGALLGNTLATALTLVVFADMARRAAAGEGAELARRFNGALWTGFALMLPITAGMIVNAPAIIELVLGYGAFASAAIRDEVAHLTRWMAVAPMAALVVRMMYIRVLADDALPVVRIAVAATAADVAIRVVLFRILVPVLGLTGIPVGLVLAPVAPALVMAVWLRRRGTFRGGAVPGAAVRPLLAASVAVSVAVVGGALLGPFVQDWIATGPKSAALVGLVASAVAGGVVLLVAVGAFHIRPRLR
ncbi:lipid II flippase MurJ [Jannaschia rubra]|uniref:lipid II flippase MurJ n=1 Tax=Jannaschia rubra TaxID=282197 RepID=UPI0024928761|nr:lipid II flippase MurJ [Jannaschia rubra]